MKDTLFNMDKSKALTRKELTFKFQQQQDSAKAHQAEIDAIHNEEVKRQNSIIYAVSAGLLLVLLLAFSIFRSLQQNRKKTQIIAEQKAEVEHKNLVIEQKNKDIIDSITYAKRLQDAILPPLSLIEKHFPESFVLYKPKDIVAGDFYWMECVNLAPATSSTSPLSPLSTWRGVGGEVILIAACDCTGHGVPGALVSVVCSNALNRAVKEFHITEPGKILDKTRELVLETFEKSEGSIQDGMDISLLAISPARTVLAGGRQPIADSLEIQWAGAYNPLWVVRGKEHGVRDMVLEEIPADKQPIGKNDNPTPFNTHSLALNKGDTLYLFTDGFADQFGGPKGKKFKYQKLKEELLTVSRQPLARQKQILEKEFENWKGELEQTDDVCVIGIRA
ncbi:MAG: SpoIIE family protein phosphatase [Bacteroidia bacterium]|nr:SpoIIE family protein phosphatase [Bacteroidia bacterium]